MCLRPFGSIHSLGQEQSFFTSSMLTLKKSYSTAVRHDKQQRGASRRSRLLLTDVYDLFRIRWLNKISKEELWPRAEQETMAKQSVGQKWNCIG